MTVSTTVSRPRRLGPRLLAALATVLALGGWSAGNVDAATATPTPTATATPKLIRIALAPLTASRPVGGIQNFTATAFFDVGPSKNFTQKVIYSSTDPNVAFPTNEDGNAGKVDAVAIGTATIAALEATTGISSNDSNESAVMTVVEAPTPTPTRTGPTPTKTRTPTPTATATPELVSLVLAPSTAKRNVGQTQNFTATGTYSDGNAKNLTQSVTYASSDPNVVQAPNTVGNKGQTIAVGAGIATISATDPGSGVTTTASGGDAQFEVVIPPTPTPTHTGPTGTPTLSATPTISPTPVLVRLALKPLAATRPVGAIQNYTATAVFSDGSEKNFTQKVVYSSTDLGVAIATNEDGNAGKVEAVGVGTATISALEPTTGVSSDASNESGVLTVVVPPTPTPTRTGTTPTKTKTPTPTPTATPKLVSLVLAPATAKRTVGQTQNFTATGTYSDGNTKNVTQSVTYSSSDPNVASAPNVTGNKGQVIAVGQGVATISAVDPASGISTAGSQGDAEFTVVVAPTPTPTHTGPTGTKTLTPTPTVSPTPVLVSLALSPTTTKKVVGGFQAFTATGTFSDGSTKNLTQRVDYASSNPAVAEATNDVTSNKGRVNAVGIGTATISGTDPLTGVSTTTSGGNASFEVVEAPTPTPTRTGATPTKTKTPTPTVTATPVLVSLVLNQPTVKKAVGLFQVYSVTGTYSNGDVKNLTQKVDYASSNPAVAAANTDPTNKSKVVAVAPGVATISATEPLSGLKTTTFDGDSVFTVVPPPTPTPTHTGPTSTGPTPTPTLSGSPTPTATPMVVSLTLKPLTTQKGVGGSANFTATAKLSDGNDKNITQLVHYDSSDPTIATAPNEQGNRGKVNCVAAGTVTITATELTTGVTTAADGSAKLSCVVGGPTNRPRSTPTPGLPIQTGDATTACQKDVRRAARTFVDKKLKALDRCSSAASRCIQRKPNDPGCLTGVRGRCAAVLAKLGDDQARMIAAIVRRCSTLVSSDVLGQDGLSYGDLGTSCSARFGRTLTDVASVAQCVAAQHACGVEELYALDRPRAGELLRLLGAPADAGQCREDFGGTGAGVGDPKGAGKDIEQCVKQLVKSGAGVARTRLASVGRCIDEVFLCVHATPSSPDCVAKAGAKCDREFGKIQREIGKATVATTKQCGSVDLGVLGGPAGAYLDAVTPDCPSYGIPAVGTIGDYVACLVHQHDCEVAELLTFESPRAEELLQLVNRALVDGACPPAN